jgi:hypothetical protein
MASHGVCERGQRRSHTIAVLRLGADHYLILTKLQDLSPLPNFSFPPFGNFFFVSSSLLLGTQN